jgi:hypothetical protein
VPGAGERPDWAVEGWDRSGAWISVVLVDELGQFRIDMEFLLAGRTGLGRTQPVMDCPMGDPVNHRDSGDTGVLGWFTLRQRLWWIVAPERLGRVLPRSDRQTLGGGDGWAGDWDGQPGMCLARSADGP